MEWMGQQNIRLKFILRNLKNLMIRLNIYIWKNLKNYIILKQNIVKQLKINIMLEKK